MSSQKQPVYKYPISRRAAHYPGGIDGEYRTAKIEVIASTVKEAFEKAEAALAQSGEKYPKLYIAGEVMEVPHV